MKREERNSRSISEIINAAVKLYAESDSLEISLNELCRENSISKGKFYHYFSSKEALLEAVLNFIIDGLCKSITDFRVYPEKSLEENLNAYFAERVNFWIANPDNYSVIYKLLSSQDYSYKKRYMYLRTKYQNYMAEKMLEILYTSNKARRLPDNELIEVLGAIFESLYMKNISKIIVTYKSGDCSYAQKLQNDLLNSVKRLIGVFMYGIFK